MHTMRRLAIVIMALFVSGAVLLLEANVSAELVKLSKREVKAYSELSPFELKNTLIELATNSAKGLKQQPGSTLVLNAGRGNPNFLNTTVREAFAHLSLFAAEISKGRSKTQDLGFRPERKGIAEKLEAYLKQRSSSKATAFLDDAIDYAEQHLGIPADDLVFELADAALGDFYPSPPRILPNTEKIVFSYLARIHFREKKKPAGSFQLFATEGATAAMIYVFKSLRENKILEPGDKIGIVTPIFSPYLEIPLLNDYKLKPIYIAGDEAKGWHVPRREIEKLKDKSIKALFMVNPMNPGSISMSAGVIDQIAEIIHMSRPNLIVLTDTVYAPFVDEFHDLVARAPENTICVYSYSKYFGVTGWRLGVVMLHENNIIDRLISGLPEEDRTALHERYLIDSTTPERTTFIDRLVMDSRDVALAHTGGLSTPQQCIMALFSLFELMDEKYAYKKSVQEILNRRMANLYENLGIEAPKGPDQTHYYSLIDIGKMSGSNYGKTFMDYLKAERSPLDVLFTLAKERQTVLLPGVGFAGPEWSIRVSLANLQDDDYTAIGKNIRAVVKAFYDDWAANK